MQKTKQNTTQQRKIKVQQCKVEHGKCKAHRQEMLAHAGGLRQEIRQHSTHFPGLREHFAFLRFASLHFAFLHFWAWTQAGPGWARPGGLPSL